MIHPVELDAARQARKIHLGRPNGRPIRCANTGCRGLRAACPVGTARRLWVDGHPRGYLCRPCQEGVTP